MSLILSLQFNILSFSLGLHLTKKFHIQICEYGGREGKGKMDVVLKPCQELAFSVFFCPTTIEALSGTLVFRPRGLTEPIKYQVHYNDLSFLNLIC